jgi:hypothetical protein
LLIPNGGLCGSTCGVNVVHAMISYLSGQPADFSQNADYYVHRIVDETHNTFGTDAREGLTLPELASALRFLAEELHIRIYADSISPTEGRPLAVEDLVPADDELIIASIRKGRRADGAPAYHAIVITAAHPDRNSVWFSDPNFPNSNNRVWAHGMASPEGLGTVLLNVRPSPGADGFEGMVHDILRVRVSRK